MSNFVSIVQRESLFDVVGFDMLVNNFSSKYIQRKEQTSFASQMAGFEDSCHGITSHFEA